MSKHYPFLLFLSVILVPLSYWILIIELGAYLSQDTEFDATFGQVRPCWARSIIFADLLITYAAPGLFCCNPAPDASAENA